MSKNSLLILAALAGIVVACKTVTAPKGTVSNRSGTIWDGRGGWITVSFADSARQPVEGEFIALAHDSLLMMNRDLLLSTPLADVRSARIVLYRTETTAYAIWSVLSSLLTISNGGLAVITLPLNLIAGISTTIGESRRINYFDYPENDWRELSKYARFPQGIEGISRRELRSAMGE